MPGVHSIIELLYDERKTLYAKHKGCCKVVDAQVSIILLANRGGAPVRDLGMAIAERLLLSEARTGQTGGFTKAAQDPSNLNIYTKV
jgi:hypothetical protein